MDSAVFIAKWQASTRNERAACQEHFIDLCCAFELGRAHHRVDTVLACAFNQMTRV